MQELMSGISRLFSRAPPSTSTAIDQSYRQTHVMGGGRTTAVAVEDQGCSENGKEKQEAQPEAKMPTVPRTGRRGSGLFGDMFVEEAGANSAMWRRRAMTIVDVLVERHGEGQLKWQWVFASALAFLLYLRYAFPAYAARGARHLERTVEANDFVKLVGEPYSQVSFPALVVVTLLYFAVLHCSRSFMETRKPVSRIIFETLVVYNMAQMGVNSYVFVNLLKEAWALGFPYPWGNKLSFSKDGHRLGYFIWLHYHCCQLELLDTLFVVIRKKFRTITFLHVSWQVLNMWCWFFACRLACGGFSYFPAAVNAGARAVIYSFYSLSLLRKRGVPFLRKGRVTEVRMLQLALSLIHGVYSIYAFWNSSDVPRFMLVFYVVVMFNGLILYTDFHIQTEGRKVATVPSARNVSFSFDCSAWLFFYHFGVASWLRNHALPEGIKPEDAPTRFPAGLTTSGSSGGAMVAFVLSVGLDPQDVAEKVLERHAECTRNPLKMIPVAEDILRTIMPSNAAESMTGRVRVVLTRLSWRYPFITAEVRNQFRSMDDVFRVLRATCHVPLFGGILPYKHDGNYYLDGFLWPRLLVPWEGALGDYMVRVSALSMPSSDIKPPRLPLWWALIPPSVEVLRGLFWMGYRDAGRWFAQNPQASFARPPCRGPLDLSEAGSPSSSDCDMPTGLVKRGSSRKRLKSSSASMLDELAVEALGEGDGEEDLTTAWTAARKLVRRSPVEGFPPEAGKFGGRSPEFFIAQCEAAIHRVRRRVLIVGVALLAVAAAYSLM